jgi:hypothetical protein
MRNTTDRMSPMHDVDGALADRAEEAHDVAGVVLRALQGPCEACSLTGVLPAPGLEPLAEVAKLPLELGPELRHRGHDARVPQHAQQR